MYEDLKTVEQLQRALAGSIEDREALSATVRELQNQLIRERVRRKGLEEILNKALNQVRAK